MSAAEMEVSLAGLLPAKRMLDRLSRLDTQRLLTQVGGELEAQTRERLSETKTAPDGKPWKPWSRRYAARAKPNAKLLERTGKMIDSIAFEVGDDAVTVGSNMIYAAVHQFGSVFGPLNKGQGRIPARPFLGVSDENVEDIGALVMKFITAEAAR